MNFSYKLKPEEHTMETLQKVGFSESEIIAFNLLDPSFPILNYDDRLYSYNYRQFDMRFNDVRKHFFIINDSSPEIGDLVDSLDEFLTLVKMCEI